MKRVRFKDSSGSVKIGKVKAGKVEFEDRIYGFEDVEILPPVKPTKFVCIGLNYEDHAEETGKEIPERPKLFLKAPNAVAAHEETITLLKGKKRIDHEAELGVVIGKRCKNVREKDAMEHVMGFTCVNDLSNRDDQRIEQNWVRGKAFDKAAPIGPVVADKKSVPTDAEIKALVNGELRQRSTIDQLAFSIPELIDEITTYITLERGDIISTGTPSGVGPIQDGDEVEIEIEGIGTLRNYFIKPQP
ncbi:MAG: fumarylacetoacetate hydrolase family protein [Candidatus Aenigmatarchaeota archaeon]